MFSSTNVKAFFTTKDDSNIAYHVVDKSEHYLVDKARYNLFNRYHINIKNLKYMNQVHGNDVTIVNSESCYTCDGLITNNKNTPLMIMSADCIGLLFYDRVKKVIGVAHAGRNGTFMNISSIVVKKMIDTYQTEAKNIEVIFGPSIKKCCYEVSVEMVDIVKKNFGEEFVDGRFIDLQGINKKQLLNIGIKEKNINISNVCTKCSGENYFSYRNDKHCGRFAGIIELI